jgi:hypothetical protein
VPCGSEDEPSSTSLAPSRTGWDEVLKTRTLKNVGTEMSLHVLAYNIKRAIALVGVTGLIQAMHA